MNSCELVTFVSSLACAISRCLDKDELALVGTLLTQLGDSILTIVAHDEFCQQKEENTLVSEKPCPPTPTCSGRF